MMKHFVADLNLKPTLSKVVKLRFAKALALHHYLSYHQFMIIN